MEDDYHTSTVWRCASSLLKSHANPSLLFDVTAWEVVHPKQGVGARLNLVADMCTRGLLATVSAFWRRMQTTGIVALHV